MIFAARARILFKIFCDIRGNTIRPRFFSSEPQTWWLRNKEQKPRCR